MYNSPNQEHKARKLPVMRRYYYLQPTVLFITIVTVNAFQQIRHCRPVTVMNQMQADTIDIDVDVLVVGAGPTGLAMAAEALRHGLTCRIIERKSNRTMNQSKALVIHARTMEQLHAMGSPNERGRVTKQLCKAGTKFAKLHALIGSGDQNDKKVHTFDENDEHWGGDTDFPFWLTIPQYRTECILEEELERLGGHVEWSTCLQSIDSMGAMAAETSGGNSDIKEYVTVLTGRSRDDTEETQTDGQNEIVKCRWLIGCDGGQSFTRKQANLVLERDKSSNAFFYLADVEFGSERAKEVFKVDEGSLLIRPEGVMAILPVGEDHLFRIMAHENDLKDGDTPNIDKAFVNSSVQKRCGINIDTKRIAWSGTFKATFGVSDAYSNGIGVFIAGDAAHVHSPIGGQGMNFGLQDAINLTWKLAWAKRVIDSPTSSEMPVHPSIDPILKSYDCERREAARDMIEWNSYSAKGLTSSNPIIQRIRDIGMKLFFGGNIFRHLVSNSLSMISLQYNSATSPIIFQEDKTWSLESYIPGYSNQIELKPGYRLPNFTTLEGKKIYNILDRSRHSWLILGKNKTNNEEQIAEENQNDKSTGPGKIPLLNVTLKATQYGSTSKLSQCLLIRPDMFIAAVGENTETVWDKVAQSLGGASKVM